MGNNILVKIVNICSLVSHGEKIGVILYNQNQFPNATAAVVVDCCYFKRLIT